MEKQQQVKVFLVFTNFSGCLGLLWRGPVFYLFFSCSVFLFFSCFFSYSLSLLRWVMFFSCVFLFAFRVGVLFGPEAPKSNVPYSCKNALQTLVAILEKPGLEKCGNTSDKAWQLEENKGNTKKHFPETVKGTWKKTGNKQENRTGKKQEKSTKQFQSKILASG